MADNNPKTHIGPKRYCHPCRGTGVNPTREGGDCLACGGDGFIHPGDPGDKEQQNG